MNLQDLIDQLTSLQPVSARDARVVIGSNEDVEILSVSYGGGIVTIEIDDSITGDYDDGYKDGKRDGLAKRDEE